MNQYRRTLLLWALLLAICTVLFSSCIQLEEENINITISDDKTSASDDATPDTPEESTPEPTPPEETTPEETSTEPVPPEDTTPEETTSATTPEEITTEEPIIPPEPVEKIKIYIDQGHNPFSPTHPPSWNTGASNEQLGLYEQDITFDFGIRLAALLKQDGRFEVRLSRPTAETILGTDNDSALDFRVNDAAEWGADYFVSLHTNAYTDTSVSGLEVYTASGDEDGYALGSHILKALHETTSLRNRGMRNGSDLRILKNAQMPATLIEMGYITNEGDALLMRDSSELFVQGLYDGISNYFNTLETETEQIEG